MDRNNLLSKRIRLWTALLLVGVFAAGVVTGAALFRWFGPRPMRPTPPGMPFPFSELGLSGDQDKKAMEVMEKHRSELEAILRETYPRVNAVHETIDSEIRGILSPEQQKKLHELKSRRPPRPPRGPPQPPPGPPQGLPPPMGPPP